MQTQDDASFWKETWKSGRTGWDQGGPHPGLKQLFAHAKREGALIDHARIFSAGCGRAHNEAQLALWGYKVKAIDIVPEAVAEAYKLYGKIAGLAVEKGDLYHIDDAGAYDAIFDRAMLCALSPEVQPSYIAAVKARLKPQGLFCTILFREIEVKRHPPYAVNDQQAMALLGPDFVLCYAGTLAGIPEPDFIKEEWISVWRLRDDGPEGQDAGGGENGL